jgi:hypothetical protein
LAAYFLSYARADQTIALRFADDLIATGASVWVDQYDIHPSQHWDRAVETAVRACQGLIVMLSPRSAASPNVADEVAVAIDDGKAVIPILIEPCKPPLRMARMQFIDATQDYQTALAKCLAVLGKAAPTAYVDQAPADARSAGVSLPPEMLRQAELRLTSVIGPVAGVLVRQAAQSADETQLYETLARSIRDEAARKGFLAWLSEPAGQGRVVRARLPPQVVSDGATPLAAETIEALSKAFTRYMGPIAAHMVAREARQGGSRDALCQRLAQRIANEKDRAAFLREAAKA